MSFPTGMGPGRLIADDREIDFDKLLGIEPNAVVLLHCQRPLDVPLVSGYGSQAQTT